MNTKENEIFLGKLDKHPRLKKRFDEILGVAENSSGELVTADDAEMKAIEEVRKLGREVVQEWAITQHEKTAVEKCYRYLDNRKECLDYKNAIEKDLPLDFQDNIRISL